MWSEPFLRDNGQCVMRKGQCFFPRPVNYAHMVVALFFKT